MFITKKTSVTQNVLRGAGASLALPLLDAMIPAGTALAQTQLLPNPNWVFSIFRMAPSWIRGLRLSRGVVLN